MKRLSPIIATALLCLVAFQSWRLSRGLDAGRELDALAGAADPLAALSGLRELADAPLTPSQRERWSAAVRRHLDAVLPRGLRVSWNGGAGARRGLPAASLPGVVIGTRESAAEILVSPPPEARALVASAFLGEIPGASSAEGFRFSLPLGTEPVELSLELRGPGGIPVGRPDSTTLRIAQDLSPPSFRLEAGGRLLAEASGFATCRNQDTLDLRIADDFALSSVRVRWSGAEVANAAIEGDRSLRLSFPTKLEVDREAALEIEAEDAAGNRLAANLRVRREPQPEPRLLELTIDGRSIDPGTRRAHHREAAVTLTCRIEPADDWIEVALEDEDGSFDFENRGEGLREITLSDGPSARMFSLRADNGETVVTLQELELLRDARPPELRLVVGADRGAAPPVVEVESGSVIELSAEDAEDGSGVAAFEVRAGAETLEAVGEDEATRRRFRVLAGADEARIEASARDAVGNVGRRSWTILVAAPPPEDDGRGPSIEVTTAAGTALDPEGENVFLGAAPTLRLHASDPAGIDGASWSLEGGTARGEAPSRAFPKTFDLDVVVESGSLVIEAADRHGRRTRRAYSITVLGGTPELRGESVTAEGGVSVAEPPARFRLALETALPDGSLRAVLRRRDAEADDRALGLTGLAGEIAAEDLPEEGDWVLLFLLGTVDAEIPLLEAPLLP